MGSPTKYLFFPDNVVIFHFSESFMWDFFFLLENVLSWRMILPFQGHTTSVWAKILVANTIVIAMHPNIIFSSQQKCSELVNYRAEERSRYSDLGNTNLTNLRKFEMWRSLRRVCADCGARPEILDLGVRLCGSDWDSNQSIAALNISKLLLSTTLHCNFLRWHFRPFGLNLVLPSVVKPSGEIAERGKRHPT